MKEIDYVTMADSNKGKDLNLSSLREEIDKNNDSNSKGMSMSRQSFFKKSGIMATGFTILNSYMALGFGNEISSDKMPFSHSEYGSRQLAEIPPPVLGSSEALETLADLRQLEPGSDDPRWRRVLGYDSPGDGGGGIFFWIDSAITVDNDNDGTVVSSSTNGAWKRIYDGPVNVRWFGAKGDLINADDEPIQRALDTGEPVYIPPADRGESPDPGKQGPLLGYLITKTLRIGARSTDGRYHPGQQVSGHVAGSNRLSKLVLSSDAEQDELLTEIGAKTKKILAWVCSHNVHLNGLNFEKQENDRDWTGVLFHKINGNEDDVDAKVMGCRFFRFGIGIDFRGRGLRLIDSNFGRGRDAVHLTYMVQSKGVPDEMHTAKFGFRGFIFSRNRLHSLSRFLKIFDTYSNGAPAYGLVVENNLMDIGRAFLISESDIQHSVIIGNVINHCTSDIFAFKGKCINNVISENIISGRGTDRNEPSKIAINFHDKVDRTVIAGNNISRLKHIGINFKSSCVYTSITGNQFDTIGFESGDPGHGAAIFFAGDAKNMSIVGNVFRMNTPDVLPIGTDSVTISGFEVSGNVHERNRPLFSINANDGGHNTIQK